MRNFCTVADSNYLLKGLALYNSLKFTLKDQLFQLHWLCLDDKCYDELHKMWPQVSGTQEIVLYQLSQLEKQYAELAIMKSNPATKYGTAYSNYCWSLTPWFIDHVLNDTFEHIEDLMYIDSDIQLLKNPELISRAIGTRSVGIHTHRFSKPFHEIEVGWYNVGVVYFKNDDIGRKVASAWKGWLIDTSNPYYTTHGKTGDQKYLELFEQIAGSENVCIFDDNTNLTHLAPWCADIEPAKELMFFHFSHFRYDLKAGTWGDSSNGEWHPSKDPSIKYFYDQYYREIKKASAMIVDKVSIVGNIMIDTSKPERFGYLVYCLRSFEFMKDHAEIILNIENCPPFEKAVLQRVIEETGIPSKLYFVDGNNYGDAYIHLLSMAKYNYILNFIEDHFCVLDNITQLQAMLQMMRENEIEVMKTSFHKIENNSASNVKTCVIGMYGKAFVNNELNFQQYSKHYKWRFYVGVNFLTTKQFAEKFWGREIDSMRPHEWEIGDYNPEFYHTVLIPALPFLESIDDCHGEEGTQLKKSNSNPKWRRISQKPIISQTAKP